MIGSRHIEFGALYQCLLVPILKDIAHVEEIPDPEPFTIFLVNHHVFNNCDRQDVFAYDDETEDDNGNVVKSNANFSFIARRIRDSACNKRRWFQL